MATDLMARVVAALEVDDPSVLVDHFADLDAAQKDLIVEDAAGIGALRCIGALLDLGVSVNHQGAVQASTLLESACYSDDPNVVALLLQRGASVTLGVPLVAAADSGSLEMIKLLIAAGAPVDQALPGFPTALGRARARGDRAMEALLLAHGATLELGPHRAP